MSRVTRAEVLLGTPSVDVAPADPVVEVEKPAPPAKGKAGKPSTDPDTEEL